MIVVSSVRSRYDKANHTIDIMDLSLDDKAYILYKLAEVSGLRSTFNNKFDEAIIEDCKRAIEEDGYVDYFFDRLIKIDFSGCLIDTSLYDRNNGEHTAWTIVKSYLRSIMDKPKDYILSWNESVSNGKKKCLAILSEHDPWNLRASALNKYKVTYLKAYENVTVWYGVSYEKGCVCDCKMIAVQGDAEDEPYVVDLVDPVPPKPQSVICGYPIIAELPHNTQSFTPYDGSFICMKTICVL